MHPKITFIDTTSNEKGNNSNNGKRTYINNFTSLSRYPTHPKSSLNQLL